MSTEIIPSEARPALSSSGSVSWANIVLFVVLTFGISWLIWLGLRAIGVPFTIYAAAGMFGPALACVLVRLIRHEGFADVGLRLGQRGKRGVWRMYVAAYLIPPLLIAASILIVLLVGYQHWALSSNMQAMAQTLVRTLHTQGQALPKGMTPLQLAQVSLLSQTALAFTLGIAFNMIFTFGEEFGWRGYLLPKLIPLGGVRAALLVGVVWGVWHAPLIVLDNYNYPGHPWLGVLMMVIFTTTLSIIFAWLRFRSGSIWPSTLAHAALNAQAGFGLVLLSSADALLRAPIGLIGLLPMIAFALWLAFTGKLRVDSENM